MFYQLQPDEFEAVRPLFGDDFAYHLIVPAVIEGSSPGMVVANDRPGRGQPTAAFLTSPEGNYLGGTPDDPAFNAGLSAWIQKTFFVPGRGELVVCLPPGPAEAAWEAQLAQMVSGRPILQQERRYYQCTHVALDWRTALQTLNSQTPNPNLQSPISNPYSIHRLTSDLLNRPGLHIPDHIPAWLKNNWGSSESALENGFGFVAIHNDETIVCWCLSDCTSNGRTEVGIHTTPEHRRLGLAAITVAATVEYALAAGFSDVGWHCADDNEGSWKTAERVGFELAGRYKDYYCLINEADHLAHMGWRFFIDNCYAETLDCYQKVFALTDDSPNNYYHFAARAAAAAGRDDLTIAYLHQAIDRGWNDAARTTTLPEFTHLHGTPEWAGIVEQMKRET